MYSMDNVYNLPNTDYVSYSDPITGVDYHEEELDHEENTDGHWKGNPSETWDAPTAKQMIPTDTQRTKNQEDVHNDEVCESQ